MNKNKIEKIRQEITEYFNEEYSIEGSKTIEFLPSGNFKIHYESFKMNKHDLNWNVTKVDVFKVLNEDLITSVIVNDELFTHTWLT